MRQICILLPFAGLLAQNDFQTFPENNVLYLLPSNDAGSAKIMIKGVISILTQLKDSTICLINEMQDVQKNVDIQKWPPNGFFKAFYCLVGWHEVVLEE